MAEQRPIFISYRRGDEPGYTGWLYQLVVDALGKDAVFKDIEGGFQDGDDFPEELARRVADADVMLAVIGPGWLPAVDEAGRRRLDNPDDWVRVEIASALEGQKRVIPVLVNGADYLRAEDLPEDLAPLARKQVRRLTNDRFGPEAQALIAGLPALIEQATAERADAALRAEAEARRAEEEAARQAAAEAEAARAREAAAAGAPLSSAALEEAKELANWNFIAPRRDIDEHRDHLSRYPGGTTALYARTQLEEMVWAATDATEEALTAYLEEFADGPNAEHVRTAEEKLGDIEADRQARAAEKIAAQQRLAEEEAAFAELDLADRAALRAFLTNHPDGKRAERVRPL